MENFNLPTTYVSSLKEQKTGSPIHTRQVEMKEN